MMESYNESEKIDLIKYIDNFFRSIKNLKKQIILIFIACIALFAVKEVFFFNESYTSTCLFAVSTEENKNIYQVSDSDDELMSAVKSLFTGDMMQNLIKNELHINSVPATIVLEQVPETRLIELSVQASSAKDAYAVASTVMNNYSKVTNLAVQDLKLAVFNTPELPTSPDATPNYLNAILQAFIVALGLSFVMTLLHAIFKKSIINSEDIEKSLGLKTLTSVPYINKGKNKEIHSLLLSSPSVHYSIKKAFDDLKFRIEKEANNTGAKTFLFTSTLPNEGKTTMSMNTAISLAKDHNKVVLVDLDLRNPSIYKNLHQEQSITTILDYLQGKANVEDCIMKQSIDLPDMMLGIHGVENAPELLEEAKLKALLSYLREHYDYIILDLPPLHMMQDALIVADYCDRAIIVVKQDYAKAYDILDELEELNDSIENILGVVLNQVTNSLFDEESNHYGYGYGYGYGRK